MVDSSIALQWVLPEPGASASDRFLEAPDTIAPDIILVEAANVLAISHPVYDCVFLACAESVEGCLATRDEPFRRRASERGLGHLFGGGEE